LRIFCFKIPEVLVKLFIFTLANIIQYPTKPNSHKKTCLWADSFVLLGKFSQNQLKYNGLKSAAVSAEPLKDWYLFHPIIREILNKIPKRILFRMTKPTKDSQDIQHKRIFTMD